MSVTIRQRTDEDIAPLAAALASTHITDGYPVEPDLDLKAFLEVSNLAKAWTAELDGQPVGHLVLRDYAQHSIINADGSVSAVTEASDQSKPLLSIERLFVLKSARGHGLGQRLVEAAIQYAQDTGSRLQLMVLDKDESAMRLYRRMGWKETGKSILTLPKSGAWPTTYFIWNH